MKKLLLLIGFVSSPLMAGSMTIYQGGGTGNIVIQSSVSVGGGVVGGGYSVEPATVTFQLNQGFTATSGTVPYVSVSTLAHVNQIRFADGTVQVSSPTGGSQTPWTSDIDGGGFSLTNVNKVSASSFSYLFDGTDWDASYNSGGQPFIKLSESGYDDKPFIAINVDNPPVADKAPILRLFQWASWYPLLAGDINWENGQHGTGISISDSSNVTQHQFNFIGTTYHSSSCTASAFFGDASHLTGLPASGPFTQAVATTTVSMPLGFTASTSTITGNEVVIGTITAGNINVGSNGRGSEEVTNGTFTGSLSGWYNDYGTFSYGTNNANFSGTVGTLRQSFDSRHEGWYEYSYTITNYSGGGTHRLSDSNFWASPALTGNGTFTGVYHVSSAASCTIYFNAGAGVSTALTVDNISIRRIAASDTSKTIYGANLVQNGYSVIDSYSIANQSVSYANTAGSAGSANYSTYSSIPWTSSGALIYPNPAGQHLNLAGQYDFCTFSNWDGTGQTIQDTRGYGAQGMVWNESFSSTLGYSATIGAYGSNVQYNNAGGLLIFFDNPYGFDDYLGFHPLNSPNRALTISAYDSVSNNYYDTAYITSGGQFNAFELSPMDLTSTYFGSITESYFDDSVHQFPLMSFNAQRGTTYNAGYSFQANGNDYFTISDTFGVRLMGGNQNGYTTIDADGISTNSIKRITAMPTSDPADGTSTLWYDPITNIVYRGT